jgi:uncharacterized repeat protein (TIGR01451 family)
MDVHCKIELRIKNDCGGKSTFKRFAVELRAGALRHCIPATILQSSRRHEIRDLFFRGMKVFFNLRMLALLAGGLLAGARADAQNFALSVTNSANSLLVSNAVTYTINVTNLTGISLADAVVTNLLSAPVQFLGDSESQGLLVSTNDNAAVFDIGEFPADQVVQLTLTVEPTTIGFLTNTVTIASVDVTNTASTNVVIQVTNIVIQADLDVSMTGPAQVVITNDLMTYGVSVTNLGPDAAPNVILTSTLPPGVIFKGVSPTNQAYTVASSNLIFNLGTLADDGYADFQFTVEPTNAGVLAFSASVGSAGLFDTNTANNFADTNVTVTNYSSGNLVAGISSTQTFNPQNGLVEQIITVSNAGPSSVDAARLVVSGLTNQLFNAVGTNSGNPFVYYSAALASGQSVNLLLQYVAGDYFTFSNSQLSAFPVPLPNWTPPTATSTSTNVNISRIVEMANGDMLIEWPSLTNRTYTVVYCDNVLFSNAMTAPPSVVAPANRTQWIDYGPPTTTSAPTNSSARFYRVILNP